MNSKKILLLIGCVLLPVLCLISCKTAQTTMIVGDSYDKNTNQTTLTLLPYGNITFPDKWVKTNYIQESRQHFFKNLDSTELAVTKNPREKYPFFKKEQTDKDFTSEFVKWDGEYWQKEGLTTKILNDHSDIGFITWQITGKNSDTILLFGSKNGFAYNFSTTSKIWNDKKREQFLVDLFRNN
jgi:hypothetical protein